MVDVLVEHEYTAQEEDELTIKPGDILTNVNKMDGGWWEGTLNGKTGMFPDNFVKEVPRKEKAKVAAIPAGKRTIEPAVKRVLAKVTFPYNPEHDDELKLEIGNVVEVTNQEEEGWWEGKLNGKSGVFPSNFVELIPDSHTDEKEHSGEPLNESGEDAKDTKSRKPANKVGFGNIFEGGRIKLRSVGSKDEDPKKSIEMKGPPVQQKKPAALPSPAKEPPALPPKDIKEPKPLERARVLFSYEAENDDELTLEEGSVINILDKNLEDNGWWKGELNGKIGVFPDNFVAIVPHEEKPKKPPPPTAPDVKRNRPQPQASTEKIKKEEVKEDKKAPVKKTVQQAKKTPKLPQTDDMKAQELSPEEPDKFIGTEISDVKLHHPTANRPKAPAKRPQGVKKERGRVPLEKPIPKNIPPPPSAPVPQLKQQSGVGPTTTTGAGPTSRGSPPVPSPSLRHDKGPRAQEVDEEALLSAGAQDEKKPSPMRTRPVPPNPAQEVPQSQPPVLSQDVKGDVVSSAALEELRKEFEQLQSSTISRDDYVLLQKENQQLREDMEKLQTTFSKKLIGLMKEVDEEKKIRLNMQVEMDRVKKLVIPEDI